MIIDKKVGGIHTWKKVHDVIDIHGQKVRIFQCKKCNARGRQNSYNLVERQNSVLTRKERCEK